MSAVEGRARRSRKASTPTVSLQARVSPEVRAQIEAAADASGVSIAYYLESFFRSQIAQRGTLPTVGIPEYYHRGEELPIPAA